MHSSVIALLLAAAVLVGAQDLTLEKKPIVGSTELIPGVTSAAQTTEDPISLATLPTLTTAKTALEQPTEETGPTNPIGLESPSSTALGLPASSALSALATPSLEPEPTTLSTTPISSPKTSLASTTAAPSPASTPSPSVSSSPIPDPPKGKPLTAGAIAGISLGTLIGFGVTIFVVFICVDSGRGVRARKQVLKEEWEGEDLGHGLPEFVGSGGGTDEDVEDEKRHYGVVVRALGKMVGIGRR